MADVEAGKAGPIPRCLQNKHFDGEDALVKGQDYKYAHDFENHWVDQQYLPDALKDNGWWKPQNNPAENKLKDHLNELWKGRYK